MHEGKVGQTEDNAEERVFKDFTFQQPNGCQSFWRHFFCPRAYITNFLIVANLFFLPGYNHLVFLVLCLNHDLCVTADYCFILPVQCLGSGITAHELVSPKAMQTRDDTVINTVHHTALSENIGVNFSCMLTRDSMKKGREKSWLQLEVKQDLGL